VGFSGGNEIFDPVARKLITLGIDDETRYQISGALIGALQESDWDTEDESLEEFKADDAIVRAFAEHGIDLDEEEPCCEDADELSSHYHCPRCKARVSMMGHDCEGAGRG